MLVAYFVLHCCFSPVIGLTVLKECRHYERTNSGAFCWERQSLGLTTFQIVLSGACRAAVPAGASLRTEVEVWTKVGLRSSDGSRGNCSAWGSIG